MATAVFWGIPAHGHINPTVPLVTELVRQGERVYYYAVEAFRPAIERTGARTNPLMPPHTAILPAYPPP